MFEDTTNVAVDSTLESMEFEVFHHRYTTPLKPLTLLTICALLKARLP